MVYMFDIRTLFQLFQLIPRNILDSTDQILYAKLIDRLASSKCVSSSFCVIDNTINFCQGTPYGSASRAKNFPSNKIANFILILKYKPLSVSSALRIEILDRINDSLFLYQGNYNVSLPSMFCTNPE
ncbi:9537_t:CDS:2 [Funneliformis mosseae]|uniref:9537_t:CDS:1 n=1 Tax=Funneliformis mosseae TaxID=27381 RepID=A0A9N9FSQ7_FUNMO|nr:9537_t:CDS:2 [Funneliformis mosseae]